MKKREIVFVFLVVFLKFSSAQEVEVDLDLGKVVGLAHETVDTNLTYYAFKGIKYAEIPRRFEPSVPVEPWEDVYDAKQDKPPCIQLVNFPIFPDETEDCLYLSVYTPQLPENGTSRNLSVMVWIYGGFFVAGDSRYITYGPDYLLDEEVVVVTLNYRLSVFGFLSTGDSKMPGNNALKDIVIALQFVKDNIAKFGGNPESVTIFGESAGAALVSYLLQSPLTTNKGLFKGAIMQSGNALSPSLLQRNPAEIFDAFLIATGCKISQLFGNTDSAIDCLKNKPLPKIKLAALAVFTIKSLQMLDVINGVPFTAVIEEPSEQAAVVDNPYQFMANGSAPKVPFILGTTSEEGLALQGVMFALKPFTLQIDLNHSLLVPDDMNASPEVRKNAIAPRILDFYFQNQSIFLSPDEKIFRYVSNNVFDRPTRKYFDLVQNRVPGFFYIFSYSYQNSSEGVPHGDDNNYIWRTQDSEKRQLSSETNLVRRRMVRLWTNFAKTSEPIPHGDDPLLQNVTWPAAWVDDSTVQYLDIGENLQLLQNPKQEMYEFWEELYEDYAKPTTTY